MGVHGQADTESSAIMTKHHRNALAASFGRVLDHGLAHGYTTNPAVLLDLALRLGFSRKAPVAHGVREARLCDVQEACDALARMPPSDLERVTAQYGRARVSDALNKALAEVVAAHASGAAPASWTPAQRAMVRPLLESGHGPDRGAGSEFHAPKPPHVGAASSTMTFPRLEGLESLRGAGVPLSTFLPSWLSEEADFTPVLSQRALPAAKDTPPTRPYAESNGSASNTTVSSPPQMPGFITRGMQKQ